MQYSGWWQISKNLFLAWLYWSELSVTDLQGDKGYQTNKYLNFGNKWDPHDTIPNVKS